MADGGPSRKSTALPSSSKLEVDILRHAEVWRGALTDAALKCAALAAFLTAPPSTQGTYEVTILLTDDAEMRTLNRAWRGKDAPTNVLSFPSSNTPPVPGALGDIVLAYETIRDEGRCTNTAFSDHVSHLVIHGLLHLLGFDHMNEDDAARMEALERDALASIGVADPYLDEEAMPAEVAS